MLVSCIMPTRARPQYARRALELWQAQTWSDKELVILDDRDCPSFPEGFRFPTGVLYENARRRLNIGPKRNLCCARTRGQVIAHFDDDDEYAPTHLAFLVQQLLSATPAAVIGYHRVLFSDGRQTWVYHCPKSRQDGNELNRWVIGASLMYYREFWRAHPFRTECRCGEDGDFMSVARDLGALISADGMDMLTASIHPGNTSPRNLSGTYMTLLECYEVGHAWEPNPAKPRQERCSRCSDVRSIPGSGSPLLPLAGAVTGPQPNRRLT